VSASGRVRVTGVCRNGWRVLSVIADERVALRGASTAMGVGSLSATRLLPLEACQWRPFLVGFTHATEASVETTGWIEAAPACVDCRQSERT
jgi:hypothetical protein